MYLFTLIKFVFFYIYISISRFFNGKQIMKKSDLEKYIETRKKKFTQLLKDLSNYTAEELQQLNKNIVPSSNEDEYNSLWKSRILMDATPRGNIIMFYDTYKMAFSYYSDTNGLPYSILNMVAMRYVTTYNCFDYFIDNEIATSLIIAPVESETPAPTSQPDLPIVPILPIIKTPFAKFKNYKNPVNETKEGGNNIEMKRNVFINMGKMVNFSFIQKRGDKKKNDKIRKILFKDTDPHQFDDVFQEPSYGDKKMSYLEYKKSKSV